MPRLKFTAKGIEALVEKAHKDRTDYFDATTPGLCLRIGPSGKTGATWYYFHRVDGKLSRLRLGTHVELHSKTTASFTEARAKVAEVEALLKAGKHPKAEQARQRAAKREAREIDRSRVLSTAAELWQQHHLPKVAASTRADYARALKEVVERFGDQDLGTIKRGAIIRFLDEVQRRAPSSANRCAVILRQLFQFARDRFDLEQNPVIDLRNPAKQNRRKRTLDRHEVRILWRACELAGYPYGHALRFALCTGQRIGEVGSIRPADLDSTGDYWQQTANKSSQRIDVFLGTLAKAILAECPNMGRAAPYFHASTDKDGNLRPVRPDAWFHALRRHITPQLTVAAEELGLDPITAPWTPHDLRRTVRTGLTGWCRVSPDTAERVLNHSIGGLRAVYDYADYRPHVAEALRAWDDELRRILQGQAPTVVPITSRRSAA